MPEASWPPGEPYSSSICRAVSFCDMASKFSRALGTQHHLCMQVGESVVGWVFVRVCVRIDQERQEGRLREARSKDAMREGGGGGGGGMKKKGGGGGKVGGNVEK